MKIREGYIKVSPTKKTALLTTLNKKMPPPILDRTGGGRINETSLKNILS